MEGFHPQLPPLDCNDEFMSLDDTPVSSSGPSASTRSSESTGRSKFSSFQSDRRSSHDSKPRLSKEQHETLENHFRRQPKPSTSTKKNFAETLDVPLDKINVRDIFQSSNVQSR